MNHPDQLGPGPLPFELARLQLKPLLRAHGFRVAGVEYPRHGTDHAFAEFHRPGLRLRLVWEGEEQVLWIESARQAGVYIIGRWVDIEWAVAGRRLPLNYDTSEARIAQLLSVAARFLEQGLAPSANPPLQ